MHASQSLTKLNVENDHLFPRPPSSGSSMVMIETSIFLPLGKDLQR